MRDTYSDRITMLKEPVVIVGDANGDELFQLIASEVSTGDRDHRVGRRVFGPIF